MSISPQPTLWWSLRHRSYPARKSRAVAAAKQTTEERVSFRTKFKRRSTSVPSKDRDGMLVEHARSTSVPRVTWAQIKKKPFGGGGVAERCKKCEVCENTRAQACFSPAVSKRKSCAVEDKENHQRCAIASILKITGKDYRLPQVVSQPPLMWRDVGAPLACIDNEDYVSWSLMSEAFKSF